MSIHLSQPPYLLFIYGFLLGSIAAGLQGPAVVAGSWFAMAQSIGATAGVAGAVTKVVAGAAVAAAAVVF